VLRQGDAFFGPFRASDLGSKGSVAGKYRCNELYLFSYLINGLASSQKERERERGATGIVEGKLVFSFTVPLFTSFIIYL
jgi:hypothetical protein